MKGNKISETNHKKIKEMKIAINKMFFLFNNSKTPHYQFLFYH